MHCADCPEAADNTARIADLCELEFEFGHYHLPEFTVPDGENSADYLRKLCLAGFEKRYGSGREDVREQLKYELEMIERMERWGEVAVIRPERKIEVGRVEKDIDKLERLYEEGFMLGERFCKEWS